MPTRRDVLLNRVERTLLGDGVEVPPSAKINQLTLREKLQHQIERKLRPYNRDEALAAGYEPAEIDEVFGKEAAPAPSAARKPLQGKPLASVTLSHTDLVQLAFTRLQNRNPTISDQDRYEFRVMHFRDGIQIDVMGAV